MWQQAARQSKGPIELGVAWHLAEVTGTPDRGGRPASASEGGCKGETDRARDHVL